MKSRFAIVGVVGAAAVTGMLLGTGAATATTDGYAGKKYSDAAKAARAANQTVVIASRVGSKLAQDDCIVIRSQSAPFMTHAPQGRHSREKFAHVSDTLQFFLNCNG